MKHTRRNLWKQLLTPPAQKLRQRPPGAVQETRFLELCTRCDECVEACPHGAILKYNHHAPFHLQGTPVIRPHLRACHMCEDFPCAKACSQGALQELPLGKAWRLGKAEIDPERCIAYLGPECGACRDQCPIGIRGLYLVGERPHIDESQCVGCGLCLESCVTTPSAIKVVPLER